MMKFNFQNEIIKSNLKINGRVLLATKDSWITINHCNHTKTFEIDSKCHTSGKQFVKSNIKTLDIAIDLANAFITLQNQILTKII